jgi:hypothetical protein
MQKRLKTNKNQPYGDKLWETLRLTVEINKCERPNKD